jgi:hypothetical protein
MTVNFTLTLAAAKEALTVSGEAPLVNPDNPNTATTLNAPALENLPNPGGDMTYPLQFAAGALINGVSFGPQPEGVAEGRLPVRLLARDIALGKATPAGFDRIVYIEQPTARDLEANRHNVMHEASRLRPVVISTWPLP